MKRNKAISSEKKTTDKTSQNISPEDICYSSEDIVKDLKHWEHSAGFSKEIRPTPGPYLDSVQPWNHFMNDPIRR